MFCVIDQLFESAKRSEMHHFFKRKTLSPNGFSALDFQTDDGHFDWVLRLIVHPRPDRPGDELCRDSVQIFLHLHNAPRDTAHLKCQFVFVRHSGSAKEDHTYQISRFREFRRGETWGFRRFIQRSTLFEAKNGFIQNDRLTVKINLDIIRGTKDEVQRTGRQSIIPKEEGLQASMLGLFQSRAHSDVVLVAQDKSELPAHKAILVSRSPVFSAMLSHDLAETQSSKIEINDVPKDVLVRPTRGGVTSEEPHLVNDIMKTTH
jgi:BTB/POZ domain